MINVRSYRASDLSEVNTWYAANGMKEITERNISKEALIAEGVGMGFLVQTDMNVAFLDGYVTNPKASSEDRAEALYDITILLLARAKDLGFFKVIALTKEPNIVERSVMHGFKEQGFFHLCEKEI